MYGVVDFFDLFNREFAGEHGATEPELLQAKYLFGGAVIALSRSVQANRG